MPLTLKGEKVMRSMMKTYGSKDKAERVFYASENKGILSGVHKKSKTKKK